MNKLLPYQDSNKIELGIDEAGRGCLFGPVFIAGVILPINIQELIDKENEGKKRNDIIVIKDSKKLSKKKRMLAKEFIEKHALFYEVIQKSNTVIDEINILNATLEGMHDVVKKINSNTKIDKILVDGNRFRKFIDDNDEIIEHECVIKGDDTYLSIACASILAKTYKDNYIENLVQSFADLSKYDLVNNSGYGTQNHINAIKKYGITQYHRKTFNICTNKKEVEEKKEKRKEASKKPYENKIECYFTLNKS